MNDWQKKFLGNWRNRNELEPQVEEIPERTEFITILVEVKEEELRQELRKAQEEIEEFECVDPVPEDYFHITVKLGGFLVEDPGEEDELGEDHLDEIVEEIRQIVEKHESFRLEVRNLNLFSNVVFAETYDIEGELESLHNEMCQIEKLMNEPYDFLPNVTLCHFGSEEEFGELVDRLEEIRKQEFGGFEVEEISLVRDDLKEGKNFEVIESFKL
ncbi:MAG: 2'-5' RNA ligase family protein [Candidatus Nanohaloarchaea archaeon]